MKDDEVIKVNIDLVFENKNGELRLIWNSSRTETMNKEMWKYENS